MSAATAPKLFAGREPRPLTDLALLEDYFETQVRGLFAAFAKLGYTDLRATATLRTDEHQAFLYGIGREYRLADGRGWDAKRKRRVTVTNAATAAGSWHGYRLAVDVFSPAVGWNTGHKFWRELLAAAPDFRLRSGADWNANGLATDERLVDWPHLQLRYGPTGLELPRSPSDADRADYAADRLDRVFARYGLRGDAGAVAA